MAHTSVSSLTRQLPPAYNLPFVAKATLVIERASLTVKSTANSASPRSTPSLGWTTFYGR